MFANLFSLHNYLIHVVINILYRFVINNGWSFMDVSRFTRKVAYDGLL